MARIPGVLGTATRAITSFGCADGVASGPITGSEQLGLCDLVLVGGHGTCVTTRTSLGQPEFDAAIDVPVERLYSNLFPEESLKKLCQVEV